MICPRCTGSLTRKQRTGRLCAHCGKRFALDPAVHGTGMHDLRIRSVARRGTDHGRLKITLGQLWYLSRTRNYAWAGRDAEGVPARIRWLVALPVSLGLLLCAALTDGVLAFAASVAGAAVLVVASAMRHRPAQPPTSQIIPSEAVFRGLMNGAWTAAYRHLPDGVIDDARPLPRPRGASPARVPPPVSRPRALILCTDPLVSRFLTANGIPDRLDAVLLEAVGAQGAERSTGTGEADGADVSSAAAGAALQALSAYGGALPVVVLHDADPMGVLLAPLIRGAQPGRIVVDAGLPVSAARGKPGVVRLARQNRFTDAEQLRTVAGLPEADAAWLAAGFWSPVAAVPPRVLESAVLRAVERALAAPPPGPLAEHTGGFLTWPQDPQTPHSPRARQGRGTGRPGAGTSKKEGPRPA
ncbi:hypothetical protein OG782_00955 [Streptomyces sp. NBC_00876]|uniref:hypothetical protein n=1 Tax=Streptomyces sp. NBC_00876 TaxID=2975853 RepID=UPI00386F5F3A|nr:hypothetical protein OG782_00955 [Streptomyces sp. NBC_00876]